MIPYGKQEIRQDDIDAVIEVLESNWLTQGPKVPEFEQSISQYCHVKHAIAVNSATSALHIACLALGVTTNDIVWTSPISFVASSNCALYCGATVDFVDINVDTANICVDALAKKLAIAAQQNTLPKALVVVHMGGLSAPMADIYNLVSQYNIAIIEDASHAIGGQYQERVIGDCRYSDICVFSFHPVKIITCAEGGIATTNSDTLASKMTLFRSHGITKDANLFTQNNENAWHYEQHHLGYNYRLTELNAALGVSQIKRLDEYVAKRNELAQLYRDALTELPASFQAQSTDCYSAYHLMIMRVHNDANVTREQLFNALRAQKIGVNVHYIPIHFQPYYQQLGFKKGDFPNAETYYQQCISIPLFPSLSAPDQQKIISEIRKALR